MAKKKKNPPANYTGRAICHFFNNLDCKARGQLAQPKQILIIWVLTDHYYTMSQEQLRLATLKSQAALRACAVTLLSNSRRAIVVFAVLVHHL